MQADAKKRKKSCQELNEHAMEVSCPNAASFNANIELMMSWGWRFVGRAEPPSKLVSWSRLHWSTGGLLGGNTGSF